MTAGANNNKKLYLSHIMLRVKSAKQIIQQILMDLLKMKCYRNKRLDAMVIQCELCSASNHSTEELHRHFGSHFTPGQCKNCHKQLILIDGQCYVLQLHNQLNCNQSRLGARNEYSDIGEIKTEIEELEQEIFPNCILSASSSEDECEPSDRVKENVAIEYVEIQPFEMIECGEIKVESENKNDFGSKEIVAKIPTTEATNQNSDKKTLKTIKTNQLQPRFHCEICGKDFSLNHTLKQHKRLHAQAIGNQSNQIEMEELPSTRVAVKPTGEMYLRDFKCNICSKYLLSERTLRSHMKMHCRTTTDEILSKEELDQLPAHRVFIDATGTKHLREHECQYCGKCFMAYKTLREHLHKYHLPTNKNISLTEEECYQYPPEQIGTRATGAKFLKKFQCTICNRYFTNQKNLTKHLKDHEERAKHVLTSDEMARLPPEQILVSSTGEMYARRYKCSICNKHYISNECLNMHMRCHKRVSSAKKLTDEDLKDLPANRISTLKTGEKVLREHKCELCGKYVLSKNSLKVHMNYVHGFKEKKIEKPRLLTNEESKQYPPNQVSITSNGDIFLRKYQCDICKKYILTKQILAGHMRDVHCRKSQTKPIENHVCDACGKEFKSKGALNAHKWTHSNTQRFICSYCGKGFKNKQTLDQHLSVHTGLKPFNCRECDKTFARKNLLYVHQRVHTGEKPFKCDQEGCERAYAHGSDLNRHLYGAHRIYKRKYECQICPRIFHEKKLLTKHMLTHD